MPEDDTTERILDRTPNFTLRVAGNLLTVTAVGMGPLVSPLFFQDEPSTRSSSSRHSPETLLTHSENWTIPSVSVHTLYDADPFWDGLVITARVPRFSTQARRVPHAVRAPPDRTPRGLGHRGGRGDRLRRPSRPRPFNRHRSPGSPPAVPPAEMTPATAEEHAMKAITFHHAARQSGDPVLTTKRALSYRFTPHFHPYVGALVKRLLDGSSGPAGRRYRLRRPRIDGCRTARPRPVLYAGDLRRPTHYDPTGAGRARRIRSRTSTSAPAAPTRSTTGSCSSTCRSRSRST